jgi:methyl-accepting chemotaxis protein
MRRFSERVQKLRRTVFVRLLSGFVSVSIFIVIIGIISLIALNQLGDSIVDISESQSTSRVVGIVEDEMEEILTALKYTQTDLTEIDRINSEQSGGQAEISLRPPYISYGRSREDLLDSFKFLQETRKTLKANRFVNGSLIGNLYNRYINEIQPKLDQMVAASIRREVDTAKRVWLEVAPQLNNYINDIEAFTETAEQLSKNVAAFSEKKVQEGYTTRTITQWIVILVGLLVVGLAIVLGITLTYSFTRPVDKLRQRLLMLAEGDLVSPLEIPNQDQFTDVADTFNQSIARLGTTLQQVQEQAVKVSSASAQIATASRQTAQISADQAGTVAQATVTMEELSFTAQQIAEAATLVAQAAEQALSGASDGQETVKESIYGINSLKDRVQDIAHKILILSERSQRVGYIIEQITSIADRTHLLALNAAIESAAAGESGKRFAIVAAEVKKLAENSRSATKEVQAVLNEIQEATNASVMATEQGMKDAEKSVGLAHRTGDANQTIIMMVERTAQLSSAISLATQQQRGASEQVVTSMRQLASVIQEGATSARQSSALAISLDDVANDLRLLASQFKVEKSDDEDHSATPDFERLEETLAPPPQWDPNNPSFGPALG